MAFKVKDALDRVRTLLQDRDDGGIRWLDSELLGWFNEACAEIARLYPESSAQNKVVQLVAGTKQSIPAGGTVLMQIIRNFTTPDVAGRAIKLVDREIMDRENPDWHMATASPVALRYMFEPLDPLHFYVYPPQPSLNQGFLELVYSSVPEVVELNVDGSIPDAVLPLPDIYLSQVINYVCFRAYQKNLNDPDSLARSQEFYVLFSNAAQSHDAVAKPRDPNLSNAPR